MTTPQLLLSLLSIALAGVLGTWGVMRYFDGRMNTRLDGLERRLTKKIDEIEETQKDELERIHSVEIQFERIKGEMAEKYPSRPEINRMREDFERSVANIRSMCARRHGEASS